MFDPAVVADHRRPPRDEPLPRLGLLRKLNGNPDDRVDLLSFSDVLLPKLEQLLLASKLLLL